MMSAIGTHPRAVKTRLHGEAMHRHLVEPSPGIAGKTPDGVPFSSAIADSNDARAAAA